jgi:hypothetical protein
MFKLSPASLQIFTGTPIFVLEDRIQYNTVHFSNVFRDGHLQIINSVGIVQIFLYCNHQVLFDHPAYAFT